MQILLIKSLCYKYKLKSLHDIRWTSPRSNKLRKFQGKYVRKGFRDLFTTTSLKQFFICNGRLLTWSDVGLGGLGVTYSPRDPRFAGSNPTEVYGYFQDVKILSTSPPGETLSRGSRL